MAIAHKGFQEQEEAYLSYFQILIFTFSSPGFYALTTTFCFPVRGDCALSCQTQ